MRSDETSFGAKGCPGPANDREGASLLRGYPPDNDMHLRSMKVSRVRWGWISAVLLIAGCTNPFQTREPNPPESGRLSWIPPRRPEIVLENLKNAILEQNVENYLRCLSDSSRNARPFQFIADPQVASENPGTFETWTLDDERAYFSQLRAFLPDDSLHFLTLEPVQFTQYADSAFFVQNYILTVRHTQQKQGVPGQVSGQARFWMGIDPFGDWSIYRWEDRSLGDRPTWSVLKAIFGR